MKKVKFNRPPSANSFKDPDSSLEQIISKKSEKADLKRRVKKNQTIEDSEAKHDLMTALRVAMRKMLEEAIKLTEQNMKDNRKELKKQAD